MTVPALTEADFPLTVTSNVVFRASTPFAMFVAPSIELAVDIATRLNEGEYHRRERIAALRKQEIKEEVLAAYEEERAPPPLTEQLGRGEGWSRPPHPNLSLTCNACDGTGRDSMGIGPCGGCDGAGRLLVSPAQPS